MILCSAVVDLLCNLWLDEQQTRNIHHIISITSMSHFTNVELIMRGCAYRLFV